MKWNIFIGAAMLFVLFTIIAGTIDNQTDPLNGSAQGTVTSMVSSDSSSEPSSAGFYDSVKNWIKGVVHVITMPARWVSAFWKTVTFNYNFLGQGGYTYVRYLIFLPIGVGLVVLAVLFINQVARG